MRFNKFPWVSMTNSSVYIVQSLLDNPTIVLYSISYIKDIKKQIMSHSIRHESDMKIE